MAKRIIILTGSELRHTFFRKRLAWSERLEVVQSYCEGVEKSLGTLVAREQDNALRLMHLQAREQSERDFFELYVTSTEDRSQPVFLPKGAVNLPEHVEAIIAAKPDLLVAYGCSIIKEPLLEAFRGRFMNIHLGLSPYYRGSGTNYWPLVNREPEYVGATFMHIDPGVDTGEVIHQIRARMAPGDTAAQIGNRLIVDMSRSCQSIAQRFEKLPRVPQIAPSLKDRYYKKKDYTEASVKTLYANFAAGMIEQYLDQQETRCAAVPIISNPGLPVEGES